MTAIIVFKIKNNMNDISKVQEYQDQFPIISHFSGPGSLGAFSFL